MIKGFTSLEILLVIGILAILAALTAPLTLDFYRDQQLDSYTKEIIDILRMAQLKSMSVESDANFGVYFTNDHYTLFKGDSYSTRDTAFDETFYLPQVLTESGLQEVVFLKYQGAPKETPAYCGGVCTPCSNFTKSLTCRNQDGCSWVARDKICTGSCTACDNFLDQTDCENQSGCSWYSSTQGGDIVLRTDSNFRTININEIGRISLK